MRNAYDIIKFSWRFYFVSYDCNEPPHVHVSDDVKKICKFWLKRGVAVYADNSGYSAGELRKIEKEIILQYNLIVETFHEFCKNHKK